MAPDTTLALRELRDRGCTFDAVFFQAGWDTGAEAGDGGDGGLGESSSDDAAVDAADVPPPPPRRPQRSIDWRDHVDVCTALGVPPHEVAVRVLCVGTITLAHVDVEVGLYPRTYPRTYPGL